MEMSFRGRGRIIRNAEKETSPKTDQADSQSPTTPMNSSPGFSGRHARNFRRGTPICDSASSSEERIRTVKTTQFQNAFSSNLSSELKETGDEESSKEKFCENKETAGDMLGSDDDIIGKIFHRLETMRNPPVNALDGSSATFRIYIESLKIKGVNLLEKLSEVYKLRRENFEEKVVMDFGCDLGLRSLLAVYTGAKRTIAIESSPFALLLDDLATKNQIGCDKLALVLCGKLDEIDKLPYQTDRVDTLLSNWMGLGYFHRNLLPQVIKARKRWMTNPVIIPNSVQLFICALSTDYYHVNEKRWKNMGNVNCGFLRDAEMTMPIYGDFVDLPSVCTNVVKLHHIDAEKIQENELQFTVEFSLKPANIPSTKEVPLTAFTVSFQAYDNVTKRVVISNDVATGNSGFGMTTFCIPNPPRFSGSSKLEGRFTYIPCDQEDPMFIIEYFIDDSEVVVLKYSG